MTETLTAYRFAEFELDLNSKSLLKDEQRIQLPERNFQLLVLLAESSPEPVTKETLFEALWSNTVVSEWSLFRLVSDTRQLIGDDGELQNIIRTARGVGFYLANAEPVFSDPETLAVSNGARRFAALSMRHIVSLVVALILIVGLTTGYPYYQQQQLVSAAERISTLQDNTYTMFLAQVTRRNELVSMIEQRTGQARDREFEKFFALHYPTMNEQELFVFAQIRAMTEKGLYQYNKAILDELQQHPALYDEIDMTFDLQQHLEFWLQKYQNLFLTREDMCLLYVGVEDGVPYPSNVDQHVKDWILANGGSYE